MVNNNSYFYISGFISISLFAFFTSLIFIMMFKSSKIDIYALEKKSYISVSIELPKKQTNTATKEVAAPVVEQIKEKPKNINIDDLFSDVWTKKIKKTKKKIKKKVDNRRLLEIQKKSKKIDKKNIQKVIEKKDINIIKEKSDEVHKVSSATVVNEYLAKIQALVYENFVPPQNSQGHSVKAVIELSSIGKVMDFRILNYSANNGLNKECDKIKNRLMRVLFPANPQNSSGNYIIMLTSKE